MALVLVVFLALSSSVLSSTETEKVDRLQDQVLNLETKLDKALAEIERLKNHQEAEKKYLIPGNDLENKLDKALADIQKLQRPLDADQVAFSVYHDAEAAIQPNQRIQYNKVLTNVGGGYMIGQHEFLCPVSGMYMFTHTIVASTGYFCSNMYMDEAVIGSGWANANDDTQSGSSSAVTQCQAGSRVYIQCGTDFACHTRPAVHGLQVMQMFSGYLIYATDD